MKRYRAAWLDLAVLINGSWHVFCRKCWKLTDWNDTGRGGCRPTYRICRECNLAKAGNYAKTDKGRASQARADARVYLKYRYKARARALVHTALDNGTLIKPKRCFHCRGVADLEGHHEDYTKPLEVLWLCQGCHVEAHDHWGRPRTVKPLPFFIQNS